MDQPWNCRSSAKRHTCRVLRKTWQVGAVPSLPSAAGAWQDFAETWKGTLEVGMVADLCLVAEDLLAIDPDAIPGVRVRMTVFDGNVIHEA